MTLATPHSDITYASRPGPFARVEAWLDARGRTAWIIAMVLGFIVFWPIGLAILAYMIWGKGMFAKPCRSTGSGFDVAVTRTSGNAAFDAYRDETMRRLEEEQGKFEAFLDRLRDAKDKAEFDAFMDERARKARSSAADTENA